MTWQLPEGRDLTTWWKPENANTSAVTPVTVQLKDEANVDNNQQGQCYQNVFGVFLGHSSQYPSVVNSGKRNINNPFLRSRGDPLIPQPRKDQAGRTRRRTFKEGDPTPLPSWNRDGRSQSVLSRNVNERLPCFLGCAHSGKWKFEYLKLDGSPPT